MAKSHQFRFDVDPYKTSGDSTSGLLPGISSEPLPKPGTGDKLIQAYCFRMWLVKAADGRMIPKPANYNRDDYALLLRYMTTKPDFKWSWTYATGPIKLNIGDCNNAGPVSIDYIGGSNAWPEADYETREKIFQAHVTYQQGMMWFLANDPEIAPEARAKVSSFGLPKDQFEETDGWPHDLYVREGRRMVSDYVMTQADCSSQRVAADSVGLGSYTMDSHHTSRVVIDGKVMAEGNVEVGIKQPYPISYRSIVPKESECANLLVSVAISSSHMAFGSIRMEPVFMILGQSAATAAVMAIDGGTSVQAVNYPVLRERLLADKQRLSWE